jgi:hypothetical protein
LKQTIFDPLTPLWEGRWSVELPIIKSKGMNVKAIRKILAERRREKGELEEEKAVIELYKSFLGM